MQNPAIYMTLKTVIVSFEHNDSNEKQLHGACVSFFITKWNLKDST